MLRIAMVSVIQALCILSAPASSSLAGRTEDPITLVRHGEPLATIVLGTEPTRSAQLAAAELQYHVEKNTGAKLPVVSDTAAVEGTRILVGESKATGVLGLHNKDFKHQEYLVRCQPGLIVLMGRDKEDRGKLDYADADTFPDSFSEQGTCYAVYDFLEKFCDVRWYLPTELGSICPKSDTLELKAAEIRRSPHMTFRWVSDRPYPADLCGDTVKQAEPPPALPRREQLLFLHRHRLGGREYRANHSLYGYYDRFLATHPEWFAQGYEGRPPQMCYTHPGLIEQVVQDARDYFDGKGEQSGAMAMGDFFAVVPMDNSPYCKCPNCAAVVGDKKPATRGKGQFSNDEASNYLFRFVNEVAKEIKTSHPQKRVGALAYSSYAYPPTDIKLEPNISIQLCLHARNMYLPVMPTIDREMIDAWVAESKDRHKLLWLYYCFQNTTDWGARQVAPDAPQDWTVVTCDLWKDFGNFTLTGIAPTAMGGEAFFDRIELARSVSDLEGGK